MPVAYAGGLWRVRPAPLAVSEGGGASQLGSCDLSLAQRFKFFLEERLGC